MMWLWRGFFLQVLGRKPLSAVGFPDLEVLQCVFCDIVPTACTSLRMGGMRGEGTSDRCVDILFSAGGWSGELS